MMKFGNRNLVGVLLACLVFRTRETDAVGAEAKKDDVYTGRLGRKLADAMLSKEKEFSDEGDSLGIVNGWAAEIGRYDYFAHPRQDDSYLCGATLIAKNVVLTAAHCSFFSVGIEIVIGGYVLDYADDHADVIQINQSITHPEYDDFELDNDYQLLILDKKSKHPPVCIAEEDENLTSDSELYVIGFGNTKNNGEYVGSPVLLETNEFYIDIDECIQRYSDTNYPFFDSMMCAGSDEGKSACQNDSGGPLIKRGAAAEGDVIVGVVSWGEGCGTHPGVYARISKAYSWIKEMVEQHGGELAPCNPPTPLPTLTQPPAPTYNYIGCFKDKKYKRVFPDKAQNRGATVEDCAALCKEYGYFLREFKGMCFCGDGGYDFYGRSTKCDCEAKNVGKNVGCVYRYRKAPVVDPSPVQGPVSVTSGADAQLIVALEV